jgi:hypothetical protein
MAQQHRIGTHATTISRIDGRTIVTYHDTPVVTVDAGGTITLDSGGWRSSTTKTRINQAASQLHLRFRVSQSDFQWFVSVDGPDGAGTMPFTDGMKFRVDQDARRVA